MRVYALARVRVLACARVLQCARVSACACLCLSVSACVFMCLHVPVPASEYVCVRAYVCYKVASEKNKLWVTSRTTEAGWIEMETVTSSMPMALLRRSRILAIEFSLKSSTAPQHVTINITRNVTSSVEPGGRGGRRGKSAGETGGGAGNMFSGARAKGKGGDSSDHNGGDGRGDSNSGDVGGDGCTGGDGGCDGGGSGGGNGHGDTGGDGMIAKQSSAENLVSVAAPLRPFWTLMPSSMEFLVLICASTSAKGSLGIHTPVKGACMLSVGNDAAAMSAKQASVMFGADADA